MRSTGLQPGYKVDGRQQCCQGKKDVQGNEQWSAQSGSGKPLILEDRVPAYMPHTQRRVTMST